MQSPHDSPLSAHVQTSGREALCGVPGLEPQEEYLLAGFGQGDGLRLEKCVQPFLGVHEHGDQVEGVGKAPPRWTQLSDKHKQLLDQARQLLSSGKEL